MLSRYFVAESLLDPFSHEDIIDSNEKEMK
jgi:hypothetical protein